MTWSETVNLIEEVGYEEAFRDIYEEYTDALTELEVKTKELERAQSLFSSCKRSAEYFLTHAARNNKTLKEAEGHAFRLVVGNEVVTFHIDIEQRPTIYANPLSVITNEAQP